jgi:amino acid permease
VSPFEKIEQTNRNWSAFTFTTFEVYLSCREVKEMLLEYVGLLAVLAVVSLFVSVHYMNTSDRHLENLTWGNE